MKENYPGVSDRTFWRYVSREKKSQSSQNISAETESNIEISRNSNDLSFDNLVGKISKKAKTLDCFKITEAEWVWRQNEADIETLRGIAIDRDGHVRNAKLLEKCIKLRWESTQQGISLATAKGKVEGIQIIFCLYIKMCQLVLEIALEKDEDFVRKLYNAFDDDNKEAVLRNWDAEDLKTWNLNF